MIKGKYLHQVLQLKSFTCYLLQKCRLANTDVAFHTKCQAFLWARSIILGGKLSFDLVPDIIGDASCMVLVQYAN